MHSFYTFIFAIFAKWPEPLPSKLDSNFCFGEGHSTEQYSILVMDDYVLIRHSYVIFGFFTSIKNSSRELIAGPLTNTTGTFATIRGIEVNEIVSGSCMSYAFFGGSVSNFPKKAHTLIIKNFGLLNLGPTNFGKILEKVLT